MFRFIAIFLVLFFVGNAESVDLNLKRYTVKEGLVQSQVLSIIQSPDGYLWVGTAAGLSRFDGKKFVTYFRRDGLGGNTIRCSMLDKEGNIWFGHYSGKLTKYNWKTKKFTIVSPAKDFVFRIMAITEDSDGNIWVGTNSNGIYLFSDGKWYNFTVKDGLNSDYVSDLAAFDNGSVMAAFDKGVLKCRFDKRKSVLESFNLSETDFLKDGYINDLDFDKKNDALWIASETKGLLRLTYDKKRNKYELMPFTGDGGVSSTSIKAVKVTKDSKLWIAPRHQGVFVADLTQSAHKLKFEKKLINDLGINKNRVFDFFADREGNMWIGTNGSGLFQYRNTKIRLMAYSLDMPNSTIWSICEDRNKNIWFGAEGMMAVAELGKLGIGKIKYLTHLKMGHVGKKQVINIKQDKKGNIYYTSWGNGIFKLNPKTMSSERFMPYKGFPQNVVKDILFKGDEIWAATEGFGIIRYNSKSGSVNIYDTFNGGKKVRKFFEIYEDPKGNIWFGSFSKGVVKFDGERMTLFDDKSGFPLRSVFSFAGDPWGNIWFIGYSGELAQYNGQNFKDYSFCKGIDGQPVYSAVGSDSSFWVSTPSGILRFESSDSSFSNYFSIHGFQISETNTGAAYYDSMGNIWFGMIDGIIQLKPEKEEIAIPTLPLFIDKVQVFYKDTPIPDDHKYAFNSNNLTFYYQAVSLVNPGQVRYSYKLEGYDKKWSPPFAENKATYTNLPAGKYTFKVKATDSYGRWVNKAAVYHFEIMAPFWRTWPFYLLTAFFVIFSAYFIYRRRVTRLEKYNRELEEEVKKRVAELSDEKEKVEYALNALRDSEKKFRIFTETTDSSIFIVKNGKIDYINPAGEALLGVSGSEIKELNAFDFIHPDFADIIKSYRASGFKTSEFLKSEIKIIDKSGNYKWIDLTIKPIEYNNEQVFLGTAVNISERKLAEERLLEEKEKLSVTLTSITDAVVTTDIEGNIVLMNKVAEKISGYSYKDAVGKHINEIFILRDKDDSDKVLNLFDESAVNMKDKGVDAEAVVIRENQQKMFVEYSSSLVNDSSGKLSGLVFVLRDINERKKMMDEILKANKLESLGILAGGIAHDFNNILTAIIGNLSLAKTKLEPGSDVYKRIDLSEKSSFRAKDLTQQLLTFSKGGKPIKDNAAIDELIEETVSFILSGSNVECKLNIADNLPQVNMDTGQISQVIQNLIINAQQAMPQGGTIEINVNSCELQESPDQSLQKGFYVKIEISDKGSGIPEENLNKIFDPFFSTREGGSGLGLSTAYSIIKNHSGSISVESPQGAGTTFTVLLPAVAKRADNIEDKTDVVKAAKARVLVMDDEELVLDTAAAMLEFLGYEVGTAKNGEEAVKIYQAALKNNPISAIIMDLTIPGGMGGKEAVKEILKIDPQATVIVSSGYSNDPVMAEFKRYGFKGRIKKPYNLEEIRTLLKMLNLV